MGLGSDTLGSQIVSELCRRTEILSRACYNLRTSICYLETEKFTDDINAIELALQRVQDSFQNIETFLPTQEDAQKLQSEFLRRTNEL